MSTLTSSRDEMHFSVPSEAMTLDGFRRWAVSDDFPQTGHISYINGQILIDMSPERIEWHSKLKNEVTAVLTTLARDLNLGTVYPDRVLLSNPAVELSTEPDAMFASWATLKAGRLKPVPIQGRVELAMDMEGTPDWVLEVISPTSFKKDTDDLRRAYHRAGVREYWLIDAREQEIDFQLLAHRPGGYESITPRDGWLDSPVFAHRFQLGRRRDPVGLWQYLLRCKPA